MARRGTLPEKFLHEVWAQQLFQTSLLESHDGLPVRILHPGIRNSDSGPDFLGARIQLGGTLYAGDVEIHKSIEDWQGHMHESDPRYNRVILHVVMHATASGIDTMTESGRHIPTLIMEHYLIEPVRSVWRKAIASERNRRLRTIPCCGKNTTVDPELIRNWIAALGKRRIELRIRAMQRRLHELASPDNPDLREPAARYGEILSGVDPGDLPLPYRPPGAEDLRRRDAWEQLFYEFLAESLGYSKNQSAFRRLASILTFPRLRETPSRLFEALLFGMSGLLDERTDDYYAAELKELFLEQQISRRYERMSATEWQFFRLRPHNFPTLRLAGLAALADRMSHTPLLEWILGSFRESGPAFGTFMQNIYDYFTVRADGYWRNHYTFGKEASTPIVHLIGKSRVDEMLVNVAVPFLFLYARSYKHIALRSDVEQILERMRAPGSNAVTRKIDEELLPGKSPLNDAVSYQGKIQLYKFYCRDERCPECEVGKVVFKV